jgi:hypothetical protein
MRFGFNHSLTSMFMPELVTADSLEIAYAPLLESVSMPKLGPSIDSLTFQHNLVLTRPDMPLLTSAGSLSASDNGAWSECDLESWATSLGTTCSCSQNVPCP